FDRRGFIKVQTDRLGGSQRAIEQADDIRQGDLVRALGKLIPSFLPLGAAEEMRPLHRQHELLQKLGRDSLRRSDALDRNVIFGFMTGEVNKGKEGVFAAGG